MKTDKDTLKAEDTGQAVAEIEDLDWGFWVNAPMNLADNRDYDLKPCTAKMLSYMFQVPIPRGKSPNYFSEDALGKIQSQLKPSPASERFMDGLRKGCVSLESLTLLTSSHKCPYTLHITQDGTSYCRFTFILNYSMTTRSQI